MYFDSAATTPLDTRVKEAMQNALDIFGNENSKHIYGFDSRKKIDRALERIAGVLGVSSDQLFITYSGTDSNRRALYAGAKRVGVERIYSSAVEHSSVLDEILPENRFDPRGEDRGGLVPKNPGLLALMQANSETGALYPVEEWREKFPNALLLRDYAQSFAKGVLPDLEYCDFGSFAPQKIYGPKMIGLLYLKNPENFPEISKDHHTKNVFLAEGMARAFEIWEEERVENQKKLHRWQEKIERFIMAKIPDCKIHEKDFLRVPGLINVAFRGVRGGELMTILSAEEGIAISTGSACTSDIFAPTTVIRHIEKNPDWQYPIRIGLHKFLQDAQIEEFCQILEHYVAVLRARG
jgi:cysteine desulfurase